MTYFMNAKDVSQELQISRSSAYKVNYKKKAI